jgi:hypothetical protein
MPSLSLQKKKYQLFLFLVFSTITLNGQIVINEIYIRPDGASTTPPNGLVYVDSKEYIELYNKGCTPINVSGYFLAAKQQGFGTIVSGLTIRIPNVPAAIIPPGGHLVLGSPSPGGTSSRRPEQETKKMLKHEKLLWSLILTNKRTRT